jgi:hypothetical protein
MQTGDIITMHDQFGTSSRAMSPSSVMPPVRRLPQRSPDRADFGLLLGRFAPVGLGQLDSVALLERIDTKYVLTANQLYVALAVLADDYWVLDIDDVRVHPYQTLYFDTADFALYMRHHAGRPIRYKVRSRRYVDTHRSFMEVKVKTTNNRTSKKRIETRSLLTHFTPEASRFVGAYVPFDAGTLEPKLWNTFSRITLVSRHFTERLTLDLDLQFGRAGQATRLPGVAIAEVKQAGINRHSAFVQQMRLLNVHPTGFSKYCIGVALLYEGVKHNNFKDKLCLLDKLMRGDGYVERSH